MQIGIIGIGRMGANMAIRLLKAGHECVVCDRLAESVEKLVSEGTKVTADLSEFVGMLSKPRARWLMLPSAAVDSVLATLRSLLEAGDIIIEGDNSYYLSAFVSLDTLHLLDVRHPTAKTEMPSKTIAKQLASDARNGPWPGIVQGPYVFEKGLSHHGTCFYVEHVQSC